MSHFCHEKRKPRTAGAFFIVCSPQALALLEAAGRRARTGAHSMNACSSRSFVDFILKVLEMLTVKDIHQVLALTGNAAALLADGYASPCMLLLLGLWP